MVPAFAFSWDGQRAWGSNHQLADACSLHHIQTPTAMWLHTQLTSTSCQLQSLCNAQCALGICTCHPQTTLLLSSVLTAEQYRVPPPLQEGRGYLQRGAQGAVFEERQVCCHQRCGPDISAELPGDPQTPILTRWGWRSDEESVRFPGAGKPNTLPSGCCLHLLNTRHQLTLPHESCAGGQPARGAGASEAVPPEHNHPSRGPVVRHDHSTLAFHLAF